MSLIAILFKEFCLHLAVLIIKVYQSLISNPRGIFIQNISNTIYALTTIYEHIGSVDILEMSTCYVAPPTLPN